MATQRRAYILVFVLGVTTVVTALGLSYISSNGTVMQQATNRYAAVRAQYVAESGATLATHFIQYPPTTVAYNGTYAGATGVAIDSGFDTVDITVTPTTPANRFTIQAGATVRNATGTEAFGKQSITTEAIIPPEPKWKIAQALLLTRTAIVSSGVAVTGAVHSNGSLIGNGTCTGAVSASGSALWSGGPPSSVSSLKPAVTAPPATAALYASYKVNHKSCTAYAGFSDGDLRTDNVAALSAAVNSGGTNPGRIVILKAGDFKLKDSVSFTGTLVVRGNLKIDSTNAVLTAVANYPALIVTGDILLDGDSKSITINGPIIWAGDITDDGRASCRLAVNGAAIVGGTFSRTGTGTQLGIVWDSAKSTFWDFTKTASPEPYTVLEWKEN